MRSSAPALCLLSFVAPVAAQYATDFETLNASATGTIISGQDLYYVPVAGSLDGLVMTYAGNPHGIPPNPIGGNHFFLGQSTLVGTVQTYARAQRPVPLPANGIVYVQFDILCNNIGLATPANNIGSFSFQPSTNSTYVNVLARWPVGVTVPPVTWDADVITGVSLGVTATTVLPDPAFQGLPVNVWHRWGFTIDLTLGVHLDFRITNGSTGVTTIYTPATPLLLPSAGSPIVPTDFRLFAGGADNLFAIDNLVITGGAFTTYGAGCTGTAGVPNLGPVAGSMPRIGTTMYVDLANLPLSLGVMLVGFSDTFALGSLPLPLDLTLYGFPGCNLLADPLATQFLIGAGNVATWSFAIPASNAFVGIVFFNQGLSLDVGSPGAAFSNGGRLIIGD